MAPLTIPIMSPVLKELPPLLPPPLPGPSLLRLILLVSTGAVVSLLVVTVLVAVVGEDVGVSNFVPSKIQSRF